MATRAEHLPQTRAMLCAARRSLGPISGHLLKQLKRRAWRGSRDRVANLSVSTQKASEILRPKCSVFVVVLSHLNEPGRRSQLAELVEP